MFELFTMQVLKQDWTNFLLNLGKIRTKKELEVSDDFVMTWFTGKFNKWQIFHNPPGWSKTNSNIESLYAVIKRDFTLHRRYSVYVSVEMMEDIILYCSTNPKQFHTTFCAKMVKEAKRCALNKYKL
jgi:hypothetical protein